MDSCLSGASQQRRGPVSGASAPANGGSWAGSVDPQGDAESAAGEGREVPPPSRRQLAPGRTGASRQPAPVAADAARAPRDGGTCLAPVSRTAESAAGELAPSQPPCGASPRTGAAPLRRAAAQPTPGPRGSRSRSAARNVLQHRAGCSALSPPPGPRGIRSRSAADRAGSPTGGRSASP